MIFLSRLRDPREWDGDNLLTIVGKSAEPRCRECRRPIEAGELQTVHLAERTDSLTGVRQVAVTYSHRKCSGNPAAITTTNSLPK